MSEEEYAKLNPVRDRYVEQYVRHVKDLEYGDAHGVYDEYVEMHPGDFPVFEKYKDLVYLDNSATQQKPRQVLERVEEYYREENANPLRGLYDLSVKATDAYENSREKVREFIGANSTKEIIFTRNASESLNLIAYSWGRANIENGDEILVAISEHHSDLLPWQLLAKEKGAEIKYLDCDKYGEYTADDLKKAYEKDRPSDGGLG